MSKFTGGYHLRGRASPTATLVGCLPVWAGHQGLRRSAYVASRLARYHVARVVLELRFPRAQCSASARCSSVVVPMLLGAWSHAAMGEQGLRHSTCSRHRLRRVRARSSIASILALDNPMPMRFFRCSWFLAAQTSQAPPFHLTRPPPPQPFRASGLAADRQQREQRGCMRAERITPVARPRRPPLRRRRRPASVPKLLHHPSPESCISSSPPRSASPALSLASRRRHPRGHILALVLFVLFVMSSFAVVASSGVVRYRSRLPRRRPLRLAAVVVVGVVIALVFLGVALAVCSRRCGHRSRRFVFAVLTAGRSQQPLWPTPPSLCRLRCRLSSSLRGGGFSVVAGVASFVYSCRIEPRHESRLRRACSRVLE